MNVQTIPLSRSSAWSERDTLEISDLRPEARFRLRLAAEELSLRRPADQPGRIARALRKASIDLNPHQVEAAVLGLRSLKDQGLVLADEVGLGKTIEAGLILAQLVAEGRQRMLVLSPATLRKQWSRELDEKLGLKSIVVDGGTANRDKRAGREGSVFDRPGDIVIASHPFAARRALELREIRWDVVIIDEAHRLRGAHKGSKTARALRAALDNRPKLLLTATPLQNGLGELYGLLSFLDPDLLGSYDEFRKLFPESLEGNTAQQLRSRVKPFVHRTLRRQVREYVRYTDRKSIVCTFNPSQDESRLYDEVSEYLGDPETLAIDPARRHLMVMVYRKLLASSPAAIAGTLSALARGLQERLERGDVEEEKLDVDAAELLRQLEEAEEEGASDADQKPKRPPATPSRIKGEIDRLEDLASLARSIRRPAKTNALLMAIDRAFTEAVTRGWPQKAVIFTESRRTQEALKEALEREGHAGKVVLLHGQSGDAEARAALVEQFRNDARILILTEAGAEGLNLQFCNLVVNYDLPWNPQRIEQRIGRCHRYGQTRDVVVLNFLASDNEAEGRLYELLSQKLELFDGMFGASDEPLGAVGDGAQFEKRVFDIFQSCRSEEDIRTAFDRLQADLETQISSKMAEARAQICDHFDDEIRAKLKMTGDATVQALEKDEHALLSLVQGAYPDAELDAQGRLTLPPALAAKLGRIGPEEAVIETSHRSKQKGEDFLTVDHPLAAGLIEELKKDSAGEVRYTLFDYTGGGHKISRLSPLLGSEGWWLVYRISFDGPIAEDHLVHVVIARTPEGETVFLDENQVQSLLEIKSTDIEKRPRLKAVTHASRHGEEALAPKLEAIRAQVAVRAGEELKRQREAIELTFEDRLAVLRELTLAAELAWKKARELDDRDEIARKLKELSKVMEREAEERSRALTRRNERHQDLDARAQLETTRTLIATTYFWLE